VEIDCSRESRHQANDARLLARTSVGPRKAEDELQRLWAETGRHYHYHLREFGDNDSRGLGYSRYEGYNMNSYVLGSLAWSMYTVEYVCTEYGIRTAGLLKKKPCMIISLTKYILSTYVS
jgi:hypothetical protein